jgi:hypothetical protein
MTAQPRATIAGLELNCQTCWGRTADWLPAKKATRQYRGVVEAADGSVVMRGDLDFPLLVCDGCYHRYRRRDQRAARRAEMVSL